MSLICVLQFDSVGAMLEEAKRLDWNKEGFVVRLRDGNRMKIKGVKHTTRTVSDRCFCVFQATST